ncbi:MAG: hypothetical protein AB7T32_05640 [Dehalococcoidia bacterium]
MAVWMPTRTERQHRAAAAQRSRPAARSDSPSMLKRAAKLIVEPKRASLHLATAVVAAAIAGLPSHTVSPLIYVWLALAMVDVAFTAGWKRMLSGHGEDADFTPPPATGVVMTGSISSTVKLDYDAGTAEKTYEPGAFVKALYALSFQAPFPYTSNLAAVEAARQRRAVIGLLTKYWYGENLVAPALDVRVDENGKITFVTELVRGTAPKDLDRAKALLADLTERFLDSGLPSWQVGSYNPRSIGNLIEREDGSFRIIDLESNLVTPILPPAAAVRAVRAGLYPSFDEIDVRRLEGYIDSNRESIVATLGYEDADALFMSVNAYGAAQAEWHGSEPRIASKLLKFAFGLVYVPGWFAAFRGLTKGSEQMAENFTASGIATWQDEGRLTETQAEEIRACLKLPEVASATANLGAHLAMSVPLRFPLGSIARSGWTVGMRVRGEWMALRGKGSASSARQVHTLPVAIVAGIPGMGSFAYALSKPLQQQRAIGAIALDQLFRHLSMGVYRGLHLDTLTLWMAQPLRVVRRSLGGSIKDHVRERVRGLGSTALVAAAVIALNAAIIGEAIAAPTATGESVIRYALIGQAIAAGVLGLFAFRSYWKRSDATADLDQASGIFLWGSFAVVLIGIGVDYGLGIHEAVFGFSAAHFNVLPVLTDPSEKLIILGYATIAGPAFLVLRHELASTRASSTWLVVAMAIGALVIAAGASDRIEGIQVYAQALTGAALMLAFASRLAETKREEEAVLDSGRLTVSDCRAAAALLEGAPIVCQ